jgi:hypothetical protein
MAKPEEVNTEVSSYYDALRDLLRAQVATGRSLKELAEVTGLTEETLASVRDSRRTRMQSATRRGLLKLPGANEVRAKFGPPFDTASLAPKFIGEYERPVASSVDSARPGAATFRTEEERRGYLRRVLEEARRAISDAERALDASLTGAASDVASDAALVAEIGDRARNAGQQTAPGRTAQSK